MSQPPADEQSLLAYLIGLAGLGITGALGWIWKNTMTRISNLESGKADSTEIDALIKEMDKRRDIETKLFDMFRVHEKQDSDRFAQSESASRDRHDELMTVVGDLRADIAGLKK